MADKKVIAHCFKQSCSEAPKHVLSSMPGVRINACDKHLDDAKCVAQTGRPG